VSRAKKTLIIVCDMKFWRSREEELITDILKEASPFDPQ
jgi:hypothetical protein